MEVLNRPLDAARHHHGPRRTVGAKVERLGHLRLGGLEKGGKLDQVHAIFAFIVGRRTADPAATAAGVFGDAGRR
jgi:hypothetical protein